MSRFFKQIERIAINASKEATFGVLQYIIYLFIVPAILRNFGLDFGLEAVLASYYFATIIILSVITGVLTYHPVSIGFRLLRSFLIVYVFLTAMNYGLLEQTGDGLVIRINFSILIYTIAAFTIIHSLLSSIDNILEIIDKFKSS